MLKLTVNCCADDVNDYPVCALVNIDETAMSRIRLFAAFVKNNKLYRVEEFNYSPEWYNVDVDENAALSDLPDEDVASVDCVCLNVSADDFWWTAMLKNSNIEVETEKVPVAPQKDRLVA